MKFGGKEGGVDWNGGFYGQCDGAGAGEGGDELEWWWVGSAFVLVKHDVLADVGLGKVD